jgi:hypothetical protein
MECRKKDLLKALISEIEFLKEQKNVRKDSYLMRVVGFLLVDHFKIDVDKDEFMDILNGIKEKLRLEKVKDEELPLQVLLVIVDCIKKVYKKGFFKEAPVFGDMEACEILFWIFVTKGGRSDKLYSNFDNNKLYFHIDEAQCIKEYEEDIKDNLIEILNIIVNKIKKKMA